MSDLRKVYAIVPIMAESAYLPALLDCLAEQDYPNFEVVFCVNQPDSYWDNPIKQWVGEDNALCINLLNKKFSFKSTVFDRSSKHLGWDNKNYGVGWARKVPMDYASQQGEPDDLIVSLDADSVYEPGFLGSIVNSFNTHANVSGLSIPYYHKLTGDEAIDRNILRYEFYMRNYALNMLRIGNPYAFTAIGSGMACTIKHYKKVNGITPHKSGEDFYFILKLCKSGSLLRTTPCKVYPSARYSDRVFFGTGPALIKGAKGDWNSYPIYPYQLFDQVKESFDSFPELYKSDVDFPMNDFLARIFKDKLWWIPLRKNSKNEESFVKACRIKVDALRILQFLKTSADVNPTKDENNLKHFISIFYDDFNKQHPLITNLNFQQQSINELNLLRDFLVETEDNILINNPLTSL